jgi:protein-tyrosine phosphatase
MLTREIEGAMVKCGSYWTDSTYGPLRLRLLSTSGAKEDLPTPCDADELFSPPREAKGHPPLAQTVKRTFELTHTGYPSAKARKVIHLQYLEWPDMNVPDDPRGVLGLIKEVEQAVAATAEDDGEWQTPSDETVIPAKFIGSSVIEIDERTGVVKHALQDDSPVLLHCSAGVGRTGGFIAVDAVLDAVRREMGEKSESKMDVNTEPVAVGSSTIGSGLVIPTSTGESEGSQTDKDGEGAVEHLPLADYHFLGDPMKTPMQIESEPEQEGERPWPSSNEVSGLGPSTRKWAQSVLDSTRTRHAPLEFASRSPATVSGSSSVDGSEDSSLFSFDRASRSGSGTRHTESSIGTSVSGSPSHLRSFPQEVVRPPSLLSKPAVSGPPIPLRETLPPPLDQRTRTFSAPGRVGQKHIGDTKEAIGSSPLASSPTTRLAEYKKFAPTSPLAKGSMLGASGNTRVTSDSFSVPPGFISPLASGGGGGNGPPTSISPSTSRGTPDALANSGCRVTTVDYKEPRPLHGYFSPVALTTYEEPIWQVVQDMREQRMSLCQSLRQYVFVHAAIIEGALMVVDEENERLRKGGKEEVGKKGKRQRIKSGVTNSDCSAPTQNSSGSAMGKRGASPTELLKKDKTGEVSLSKRPSVKRPQQNRSGQLPPLRPGLG